MQKQPFTALAAVYDAIMADVEYDHWADFVLTYARDGGLDLSKASALDLACGTGGFTHELLSAGLEVMGLDYSAAMLKEARKRISDAEFVQGDLRTFELGRHFDLITCVFDSLNNLLTLPDLQAALSQAHKHLKAGGLFAFDVNTRLGVLDLWEDDAIEGLAPMPDGREVHYHWLHQHDSDSDIGVVQAFCRVGDEEFIETHKERGYDPEDLRPLLQAARFKRCEILEYPDYADPTPETPRVWVFAWKEKQA